MRLAFTFLVFWLSCSAPSSADTVRNSWACGEERGYSYIMPSRMSAEQGFLEDSITGGQTFITITSGGDWGEVVEIVFRDALGSLTNVTDIGGEAFFSAYNSENDIVRVGVYFPEDTLALYTIIEPFGDDPQMVRQQSRIAGIVASAQLFASRCQRIE